MQLTNESRFSRSPEVVFQEISGETILLDLKAEHYYGLNDVGGRFWELAGEGLAFSLIVSTMGSEFDVSEDQLRADLTELIEDLRVQELLTFSE